MSLVILVRNYGVNATNLPQKIFPMLGKRQVIFLSYFQMILHLLQVLPDFLYQVHYQFLFPQMKLKIWLHEILQVRCLPLQTKEKRK